MSYFNHAYKKTFLGQGGAWEAIGQTTISLTASQAPPCPKKVFL